MRTLVILTLCLASLGARAFAEDPDVALLPDDLELVPLDATAFGMLRFEHRLLIHQLEHCRDRLEELDETLDAKDGRPSAWHVAQRAAVWKDLAEAARRVGALLRTAGVAERTLRDLAAFPKGPRRVERYAFGKVIALTVPEREAARVRQVAAAALGAVLALDAQLRALDDDVPDHGAIDSGAQAQRERLEAQMERTERRFWQLLDVLLDESHKRRLRDELPHPMREIEDLYDHAMHLPGLTIGQMARVRSLEAELESESGPDHTLVERLERQLGDAALSEKEREGLHARIDEIWNRVDRREHETKLRLQRLLTEDQRLFLQAIPPRVGLAQRLAAPEHLLRHVELTAAQTQRLVPLAAELSALRRRVDAQMEAQRERMEEMGADSPQAAGMEMRETGLAGELIRKTQAAMRTVFLDVMSADQVVQWVVVGPTDDE